MASVVVEPPKLIVEQRTPEFYVAGDQRQSDRRFNDRDSHCRMESVANGEVRSAA